MKLKNVLIGLGVIIALAAGVLIWRESRSQWVDAGFVGILYDANGGIQNRVIQPSRVYVGFRQRLYTYPTRLQSAKYLQAADEGEVKSADGILITTNENANTTFDVNVVYRVRPEDALKVFNSFGPIDVLTIQTQHIRRAIKDVVNEIGPRYDVFQLMGPKRLEFSQRATKMLQERMVPRGITIDSVLLLTAYPSPEVQEKIHRRVNQYTEYEIALLRQRIAEVTRQTNVIRAQANTVANQITGATAKDRGLLQLQLQADEEAIEKWDGHLPTIRGAGAGQSIIIDSNMIAVQEAARRSANRDKAATPNTSGGTPAPRRFSTPGNGADANSEENY